jgi:hypothetical protein
MISGTTNLGWAGEAATAALAAGVAAAEVEALAEEALATTGLMEATRENRKG